MQILFSFWFRLILPALSVVWLCTACTGTGHLSEGEQLYKGAKIKITKAEKDWTSKPLKPDLKKTATLPRPNKKILWMRPKMCVYNVFHNRREKSFGNFIANQFGEKPVLFNAGITTKQRAQLVERAANDGFFKIAIDSEQKVHKHSVQVIHTVHVRSPRKNIDGIRFPADSTVLSQMIRSIQDKSLVKAGQPYKLETLISERQRISDNLRNNGWYYFTSDNLLFIADTIAEPGKLTVQLKVKDEVAARDRQRYQISSITIYPDYDLATDPDQSVRVFDTIGGECIVFLYRDLQVRPEVLRRQIFLRCGQYYSNEEYQTTVYRLLNLNLHKFINIRFDTITRADSLLECYVYLTPYKEERLEGTFAAVFSPGYYRGVRAGVAYNHRNTFRGAEALRISASGAYLRTNQDNFDFKDFLISDASASLSFPRFLLLKDRRAKTFKTTKFSLRHESNYFKYDLSETGNFGLSFQRIRAEGGYLWKKDRRGSAVHEFNPLSLGLQYATVSNKKSREQLISQIPDDTTGTLVFLLTFTEFQPNYTFTIDQRLEPARRHTVYFRQRFSFQTSGYTRSKFLSSDYPLNSPLNLFFETDYRQYQRTNGRNVLAFRMAIGAGVPLKKNSLIALLDRYAIGGASSVRAFAPRSVGPGSEPRDTSRTNGLNIALYTGNMLLESSLEYRVPIGRYPELAFFADAGNIWLTSGADATDASDFRLNRFYRELAAGAGMGLRVNLGFFVLRLDVAFPLSKPFLPLGQRWVGNDLHFGSAAWRKENLNWNFSFGYPF